MTSVLTQPQAPTGRPRRSRWQTALAVVVVVALLVVGDKVWRLRQNRPPFGPAAVAARVSLTVVTPDQAVPLLRRLVPPDQVDPVYSDGVGTERTNVVGRLTFAVPRGAAKVQGYYAFFLLDRATGRPVQQLHGYQKGSRVTPGWDSAYNAIGARYPSLMGVGSWHADDVFGSPGMSIGFAPGGPGSTVFVGALAKAVPPGGRISDEVTVVLAFFGRDEHLYWATEVPVTQLR